MGAAAALGAYGVLILAVWVQAGIAIAAAALLLGALPVTVLLCWYSEEFAPVTGLVPEQLVDKAVREARAEKEAEYRLLKAKDGGESLEWMNFLVEKLWPKIAMYVEEMIRGFESQLQAAVPVGIRFKTCTLGKSPIRFGPVKFRTVSSYYDDKFVEEGGVDLEIGVRYDSDAEIVLTTAVGASIGVAKIEMDGCLTVAFRPLIAKPPFFGGIEVLFTNPPKFNLDFKGIGNLADMPGIYNTVRRVIDNAIAGIMVTPQRIAVPTTDDPKVDLARLKNPTPEGVLRITVCRAENLEGKDFSLRGQSTSDPYVEIKVGAESWKTPTIMKTRNPEWKQDNVHDFVVYSVEQCVQVDVFDWDRMSADDHLGSLNKIPVKKLIELQGKGVQPHKLESRGVRGEDAPPENAKLYLQVDWLWLMHDLNGSVLDAPGSKFVLTFKIDDCEGLPDTGLHAPFTVRWSIKGDDKLTRSSSAGWSKWANSATAKTLENIRKLAKNGCQVGVIADVMEVEADLIRQFLATDPAAAAAGTTPSEESKKAQERRDQEWLTKLRQNSDERERSRNPQFEEVLLLSVQSKDVTAVVELVNDPKKRPKVPKGAPLNDVVARFEVQLGDKEVVDGPFPLLHPKTGEWLGASLNGTFTIWRLAPASKNEKLRGIVRMLATKAHHSGQQAAGGASPGTPRVRKRDKIMRRLGKMFGFSPSNADPREWQ